MDKCEFSQKCNISKFKKWLYILQELLPKVVNYFGPIQWAVKLFSKLQKIFLRFLFSLEEVRTENYKFCTCIEHSPFCESKYIHTNWIYALRPIVGIAGELRCAVQPLHYYHQATQRTNSKRMTKYSFQTVLSLRSWAMTFRFGKSLQAGRHFVTVHSWKYWDTVPIWEFPKLSNSVLGISFKWKG